MPNPISPTKRSVKFKQEPTISQKTEASKKEACHIQGSVNRPELIRALGREPILMEAVTMVSGVATEDKPVVCDHSKQKDPSLMRSVIAGILPQATVVSPRHVTPGTVSLAVAAGSLHYLTKCPTPLETCVVPCCGLPAEQAAYQRQASADTETFLANVATQLRPGGVLVLTSADLHRCHLLEFIDTAVGQLRKSQWISEAELRAINIPVVKRSQGSLFSMLAETSESTGNPGDSLAYQRGLRVYAVRTVTTQVVVGSTKTAVLRYVKKRLGEVTPYILHGLSAETSRGRKQLLLQCIQTTITNQLLSEKHNEELLRHHVVVYHKELQPPPYTPRLFSLSDLPNNKPQPTSHPEKTPSKDQQTPKSRSCSRRESGRQSKGNPGWKNKQESRHTSMSHSKRGETRGKSRDRTKSVEKIVSKSNVESSKTDCSERNTKPENESKRESERRSSFNSNSKSRKRSNADSGIRSTTNNSRNETSIKSRNDSYNNSSMCASVDLTGSKTNKKYVQGENHQLSGDINPKSNNISINDCNNGSSREFGLEYKNKRLSLEHSRKHEKRSSLASHTRQKSPAIATSSTISNAITNSKSNRHAQCSSTEKCIEGNAHPPTSHHGFKKSDLELKVPTIVSSGMNPCVNLGSRCAPNADGKVSTVCSASRTEGKSHTKPRSHRDHNTQKRSEKDSKTSSHRRSNIEVNGMSRFKASGRPNGLSDRNSCSQGEKSASRTSGKLPLKNGSKDKIQLPLTYRSSSHVNVLPTHGTCHKDNISPSHQPRSGDKYESIRDSKGATGQIHGDPFSRDQSISYDDHRNSKSDSNIICQKTSERRLLEQSEVDRDCLSRNLLPDSESVNSSSSSSSRSSISDIFPTTSFSGSNGNIDKTKVLESSISSEESISDILLDDFYLKSGRKAKVFDASYKIPKIRRDEKNVSEHTHQFHKESMENRRREPHESGVTSDSKPTTANKSNKVHKQKAKKDVLTPRAPARSESKPCSSSIRTSLSAIKQPKSLIIKNKSKLTSNVKKKVPCNEPSSSSSFNQSNYVKPTPYFAPKVQSKDVASTCESPTACTPASCNTSISTATPLPFISDTSVRFPRTDYTSGRPELMSPAHAMPRPSSQSSVTGPPVPLVEVSMSDSNNESSMYSSRDDTPFLGGQQTIGSPAFNVGLTPPHPITLEDRKNRRKSRKLQKNMLMSLDGLD